jgi:hypothetical protein
VHRIAKFGTNTKDLIIVFITKQQSTIDNTISTPGNEHELISTFLNLCGALDAVLKKKLSVYGPWRSGDFPRGPSSAEKFLWGSIEQTDSTSYNFHIYCCLGKIHSSP